LPRGTVDVAEIAKSEQRLSAFSRAPPDGGLKDDHESVISRMGATMGASWTTWFQVASAAAVLVAVQFGEASGAFAGTIDTIKSSQAIRIGYRDDAPPFSYKEAGSAEPTGYVVNLCRAVAKKLADQLGVPSLKVVYVPVTAENRFDAVEKHDVDLLCEPTSATLSRREHVDFSIATFVDGAGLLSRDRNLHSLVGLTGRKIGVLSGTTTEQVLRDILKSGGIPAEIVPAKTHTEGLAMLDSGKISAYFGDRSILMFLVQNSQAPDKLAIADQYLTVEPYALAMARNDEDFRLAVDTALSHIYRSDEINTIFDQSFAGKVKPSNMLKALYELSALPD
jgi:ABC-type amino acid transport substrate-binding protein